MVIKSKFLKIFLLLNLIFFGQSRSIGHEKIDKILIWTIQFSLHTAVSVWILNCHKQLDNICLGKIICNCNINFPDEIQSRNPKMAHIVFGFTEYLFLPMIVYDYYMLYKYARGRSVNIEKDSFLYKLYGKLFK